MKPVYLDYNATTPIDEEVAQAMRPYIDQYFGNPSSIHQFGVQAKNAILNARKQVAQLIGADVSEIIFTSGGTEANNFAIKGFAYANRNKGNHIITSQVEHPAVIEVCKYLEDNGFRVTYCPVDEYGTIDLKALENAITTRTILISVMHANNEVGSIQPIAEIAKIARQKNIAIHTDAAQSLGKIHTHVNELDVDLLSIAGHKLYAPKGIGALYVRSGVQLQKIIHGADHEQNMRAGTENVLEIVGLGKASEIALRDLNENARRLKELRDLLENKLLQCNLDTRMNGHPKYRLPNTSSIAFKQVEANTLLAELNGVAASAGAACHADGVDVSSVLSAMQVPMEYAMGTIRFSVGKYTTPFEIEKAANEIISAAQKLQSKNQGAQIVDQEKIKLTQFTHGMGCACKLRPQDLELILKDFPFTPDPNILVGNNNADDAAVYQINDELAVVQTLDFFTPIVDDAYNFGAIAAANALSDMYAMGAQPLFALNIVAFPGNRLPLSILNDILRGANDKAKEAGISIIGGHTIEDTEPKYGLVVTGSIHPAKILSNEKAQLDDSIILTKPIGTGILSTALKEEMLDASQEKNLVDLMSRLNKVPAEKMMEFNTHTCTDVTGFGLIGHLREVLKASKLDARIFMENIPVMQQAKDYVAAGIIPGGSKNNLAYNADYCTWHAISEADKLLLNDAQTSGGLLIFVHRSDANDLLKALHKVGLHEAAVIGETHKKGTGNITVE